MENFFQSTQIDPIGVYTLVANLFLSLALSVLVAYTYMKTHKGLSYSQSFTFSLVLIGILIAIIMMVIGNSIVRAFGVFGAFSLIRFRTAIKDAKDIVYIFLAVAVGLSIGTNNYLIGIVGVFFAIIVLLVLDKTNFGSIRKFDYILNFSVDSKLFTNDNMRELFKKYLKNDLLLDVSSRDGGRILDYSFNIKFKNNDNVDKFISKFDELAGVNKANVLSSKNDIEY